ncbi:MAG: 1-acyl-sn-glycerol-3-phosphate acyltransferase [Acidisphaera sp.]|nr:1-acyl-sn-glycerol-3-phosphate acyltransferase [Acidisphaera sp.]
MILLRSTLFNAWFFGLTTVLSLFGVGIRWFAPHRALDLAKLWARLTLAAARRICGIELVVIGREHLPQGGPALIASQHQSAYDTMVWLTLLPHPSYVLKRELTRIPLFGPLMIPSGMIPLDRGAGAGAVRALLRASASALAQGRQVVIFPEGTRVRPGEVRPLQPGIAAVAARAGLPVIPVATDSGHRWGRRAFRKYPGPIHMVVLPPIPAGLPREALMARLAAALLERPGLRPKR